ncbi:MAG: exosortase/archaeosortase family protein [Verrucomicrobia bacterium]|nr:exosortase/archaeosortase family protein [Verrucomicrobiota bacterium]
MLNHLDRIFARKPGLAGWLLALVAGYAWVLLLWHLSAFWRVLEDYEYGWAVPVLVLALLWRRRHLPAPEPKTSVTAFAGVFLGTLLLLPLRIILDANLDWRPAVWALAAVVITVTLCAIYLAGGKPWLAALAFPALFVLTGVPWLGRLELPITSGLMRFGAFVATELLNLIGVAACQRGSVVETAAGLIGVDEACSGIKSLQTMVAVGLFLSDFTAWRGPRRFLIVLIGAVLATAANLGRLVLLAWVGSQGGSGGVERWHDPAGAVAFAAACLALVAIVRKLPAAPPAPPPAVHPRPAIAASRPSWAFPGLVLCVLWLGGAELVRLYWFQPRQVSAGARWTAVWPEPFNGAGLKVLRVSDAVRNQLQCDTGKAVRWSDRPGTEWIGYFFEWRPGLHAYFARSQHSPEICLPATGRRLHKDLGFFDIKAPGHLIQVHHLLFEDDSGPLNVFFIVDGSAVRDNVEQRQAGSVTGRLRSVWERHKEADRRSLELIAAGYLTPQSAREEAQRWLTQIIRPENGPVTL